MSKLGKWMYRHFELVRACRLWAVVVLFGLSTGLAGYFVAWAQASALRAQDREDHIAEVKRWQVANAWLMTLIESRLPAIASTAEGAAQTAQAAAETAATAASRAGVAGSTANTAATTAKKAAQAAGAAARAVDQAVTPAPAAPAEAPAWHGGS